jgi:hypothetical protein
MAKMSFIANKSYVAVIELKDSTYYVTSRPDITLDGTTYKNVVTSWGTASFYSDADEGFQTGSFDMRLVNGEEYQGGGYVFDPTEVWNNQTVTIKLYSDGNVLLSQTKPIFKGIIKDYQSNGDSISFSVEQSNQKDDILLPPILCENQTALTDGVSKFTVTEWTAETVKVTTFAATRLDNGEMVLLTHTTGATQYARIREVTTSGYITFYETVRTPGIYTVQFVEKSFRDIPDKFIDKTIPMQFGDLNDEDNGKFGKTVTTSDFTGRKLILTDYISINSFNYVGVWDSGNSRFYDAIKNESQTTTLKWNEPAGSTSMLCDNAGIFAVGDYITIGTDSNENTVRITSFSSFDVTDYSLYTTYLPISKINVDPPLTRSFTSGETITMENGEYDIVNNLVTFRHNNSILLTNTLNSADTISALIFSNKDVRRIPYLDEDNNRVLSDKGVLSQTILGIDNELMMVVSRPDYTTNTVYVERGYGGTTVTTHAANSTVVIAETFGAKNLLSFRERFDAIGACNFGHFKTMYDDNSIRKADLLYDTPDFYITSPLSKAFDGNSDTYYEYFNKLNNESIGGRLQIYKANARNHNSFNLMFDNIAIDAVVFKVAPAIKATIDLSISYGTLEPPTNTGSAGCYLYIDNGGTSSNYQDELWELTNIGSCIFVESVSPSQSPYTYSIDCFSAYNNNTTGMKSLVGYLNTINALSAPVLQDFGMTSLKELNKMPRMFMGGIYGSGIWDAGDSYTDATPSNPTNLTWSFKLYNVGLWIDFLVDFTKQTIVAPLEGRQITTDTASITQAQAGNLCEYVPDVLAQLLTQELGYTTEDFTTSWQAGLLNFSNWTQWTTQGDHPWISLAYNSNWIIAISTDGYAMRAVSPTSWTAPVQFSTTTGWTSIAASEDKFIAVGTNGTNVMIAGTENGISWEDGNNESSPYGLQDIAYGDGKFVIVGYEGVGAGVGITQPDGASITDWQSITLAETNRMISIAYSSDSDTWYAISIDGDNRIQISDDGSTFTADGRYNNYIWKRVRYVNNRFVFIPDTLYTKNIVVSSDTAGNTLSEIDLPLNGTVSPSPIDITYGDGMYAMTSQTYTETIGDAISATPGTVRWGGCAYSPVVSRYVAVKDGNSGGTYGMMYSSDGLTWVEITTVAVGSWNGVCYSETLDLFIAVNTTSGIRSIYSSDGINWTTVAAGVDDNNLSSGEDVACGSGGIVICRNGATSLLYSSNGTTWDAATSVPSGEPWVAGCYSEYYSRFTVLGRNGYGCYSSDGLTWTQFAIATHVYTTVIFSERLLMYIALAPNTMLRSVDGINWVQVSLTYDYFDIHYSETIGMFWAVNHTEYAYSFDGITWNETTKAGGEGCGTAVCSDGINQIVTLRYGTIYPISISANSYEIIVSQDLTNWTLVTDIPQYLWGPIVFNSSKFLTVNSDTSDAHPLQAMTNSFFRGKCAFSYGVDDDRVKGFEFITKIANHYNYMVNKDYEGKLDIVNAGWIFTETETGNEIKIEDILFLNDSGQRRIQRIQTGNDMIYNDFIIKYNRNNSTNEFQSVYVLPGSYTLAKSGITLDTARTNYYASQKRTMEIESEFIYEEEYAQNLAEHKANMFAEVHFIIELFIDYDHYTEINSLSSQYKLGDIIYLTGNDGGIAYDSNRKFYIKNIIISDSGRELNLHLFSVDPISEFSTS